MRVIILILIVLLISLPALAQQSPPQQNCRSAKTGKFVCAAFAKKHPKTTVCETTK